MVRQPIHELPPGEVTAESDEGDIVGRRSSPSGVSARADSVIARVRHFYADGVLARFTALDAALPALAPGARLTFVMGELPPEAATSDDREARQALTRVLAHAEGPRLHDVGRLSGRGSRGRGG
jgi:hypothetical protein